MFTLMIFPDQSAGEPGTVSVKVSQFVPSTQVASPFGDAPPGAVPFQFTEDPTDGLTEPEIGAAALTVVNENKNTEAKRSAISRLKNLEKFCSFILFELILFISSFSLIWAFLTAHLFVEITLF